MCLENLQSSTVCLKIIIDNALSLEGSINDACTCTTVIKKTTHMMIKKEITMSITTIFFSKLDNITIQEQMEWTREIELTSTDKCKTIKNGKNLVEAKKTNLLTLLTVISHIW